MSDDLSNRINEAVDIFGGTLHGDFLVEVREEIERLRAENKRLREALQWYVDNDETNEVDPENAFWVAGKDRARAALGEEKK